MNNTRFKSAVTTKSLILLVLLMIAACNLFGETPTTRDLSSRETSHTLSVETGLQVAILTGDKGANRRLGVAQLNTDCSGGVLHTQFISGIADCGTTFVQLDYVVPPWKEPTKLDLSPDVAASTLTKGKEK